MLALLGALKRAESGRYRAAICHARCRRTALSPIGKMACARSLPLLFGAAVLAWIIVSVMYRDYAAEAETYLRDRGLLHDGSGSAASGTGANDEMVLKNRKDIDAIMKKLGMSSAP